MSSVNHSEQVQSLLRKLKKQYASALRPPEPTDGHAPGLDALRQFVYSFLLWESTTAKADQAMRRIASAVVDLNELRICFPDEIGLMLGERYPRVHERSLRLRAALNDVYIREHAVTLDRLKDLSKRDSRHYLESLDGVPSYVAARVFLLSLGGHATPVDDRLLSRLTGEHVVEADATIEKASSMLERSIKAAQGVEAHLLLQAWSEDAPHVAESARSPRKKPASGARDKAQAKRPAKPAHQPARKKSHREASKG